MDGAVLQEKLVTVLDDLKNMSISLREVSDDLRDIRVTSSSLLLELSLCYDPELRQLLSKTYVSEAMRVIDATDESTCSDHDVMDPTPQKFVETAEGDFGVEIFEKQTTVEDDPFTKDEMLCAIPDTSRDATNSSLLGVASNTVETSEGKTARNLNTFRELCIKTTETTKDVVEEPLGDCGDFVPDDQIELPMEETLVVNQQQPSGEIVEEAGRITFETSGMLNKEVQDVESDNDVRRRREGNDVHHIPAGNEVRLVEPEKNIQNVELHEEIQYIENYNDVQSIETDNNVRDIGPGNEVRDNKADGET